MISQRLDSEAKKMLQQALVVPGVLLECRYRSAQARLRPLEEGRQFVRLVADIAGLLLKRLFRRKPAVAAVAAAVEA